ncbi:MAG: hypothetical protein ACPGPF_01780 [Pontibacterium sp.]
MTAQPKIQQGRRKPLQMELVGGKPPRQRVWEEIRRNRERFSIGSLIIPTGLDDSTIRSYCQCLLAGGYIVQLTEGAIEYAYFQLQKDCGAEAPRLTKDGQPVTQGLGQEQMWRCLRMLGQMNYRQLTAHASKAGVEVKEATAKRYIAALKKAGYLQVVQACGLKKGALEIVRLIPRMDTGPRPPQIQKVGVVYDPNLNKVMHADSPEDAL